MRKRQTLMFIIFMLLLVLFRFYQLNLSERHEEKYDILIQKSQAQNQQFREVHNRIILNRNPERVVFNKSPLTGYGNRIYSMLTAFLLAVVTESALVIDWPKIENFIEFALDNSIQVYNDMSFLDLRQEQPAIYYVITNSSNIWLYNKNIQALKSIMLISFLISYELKF